MKIRRLKRDGKDAGIQRKEALSTKPQVRFRLPAGIKSKIPSQMINDGYGLREKSLWVLDSIREMLNDPYWKPMALEPMLSIDKTEVDAIYLNGVERAALDNAATELFDYAQKEGRPIQRSISSIIRAAITRRFIETAN